MEVDSTLPGNISNGIQRVDTAGFRGAYDADYRHHFDVLCGKFVALAGQQVSTDFVARIRFNRNQ